MSLLRRFKSALQGQGLQGVAAKLVGKVFDHAFERRYGIDTLAIAKLDNLTIDFLIAGVNYNFGSGPTRPYVSVGLGAGIFDGLNYSSHTMFTTTFGFGVKHFFSKTVGMRLEARGWASKPDSIIKVTCPDNGCPNNWILNGDLTGGLVVAF